MLLNTNIEKSIKTVMCEAKIRSQGKGLASFAIPKINND